MVSDDGFDVPARDSTREKVFSTCLALKSLNKTDVRLLSYLCLLSGYSFYGAGFYFVGTDSNYIYTMVSISKYLSF